MRNHMNSAERGMARDERDTGARAVRRACNAAGDRRSDGRGKPRIGVHGMPGSRDADETGHTSEAADSEAEVTCDKSDKCTPDPSPPR